MIPTNFFKCKIIQTFEIYFHHQPDYDQNVFHLIHSFNHFYPGKQWKLIIDLEIEYLYPNLSICLDVWEYACLKNNLKIIDYFIKRGFNKWEQGLKSACDGEHVELIHFFVNQISHYYLYSSMVNYNSILLSTCQNGKFQSFKYLLNTKNIDFLTIDYKDLLYAACCGGNREIIKYIIHQIDSKKESKHQLYWNQGLKGACEYGNLSCIQYMIYRGANDWERALELSLLKGHHENAEMMIMKLSVLPRKWNFLFFLATKGGNIRSIQFILLFARSHAPNYEINWNRGLQGCCLNGNVKTIQYIIDQGLTDDKNYPFNWNKGLKCACQNGHYEASKLMIELGATNLNFCLKKACRKNYYDLVQFMIDQGLKKKTFFNWNLILQEACKNGNDNLVQFIFLMGNKFHFIWDWFLLCTSIIESCNPILLSWFLKQ